MKNSIEANKAEKEDIAATSYSEFNTGFKINN